MTALLFLIAGVAMIGWASPPLLAFLILFVLLWALTGFHWAAAILLGGPLVCLLWHAVLGWRDGSRWRRLAIENGRRQEKLPE